MSTSWYPAIAVLNTASPKASPSASERPPPERRTVLQDEQRVGTVLASITASARPPTTVGSPRSIVVWTRPRSRRPRNALFAAIECPGRSPTTHSAEGSNTTRFAGRPGDTGPPCSSAAEDPRGRGGEAPDRIRQGEDAGLDQLGEHHRQRRLEPRRPGRGPGRTPAPSPRARAARDRWPPRRSSRSARPARSASRCSVGAQRRVHLQVRCRSPTSASSSSARWCGVTSAVTRTPRLCPRPHEVDRSRGGQMGEVQPPSGEPRQGQVTGDDRPPRPRPGIRRGRGSPSSSPRASASPRVRSSSWACWKMTTSKALRVLERQPHDPGRTARSGRRR